MALNFNCKDCDDSRLTDEVYSSWCETVVFHTMFLGMPHITDENWVRFAMRWNLFEIAQGRPSMSLTERCEIVKPWIGLVTNVSTISNHQFSNRLKEISAGTEKTIADRFDPETLKEIGRP